MTAILFLTLAVLLALSVPIFAALTGASFAAVALSGSVPLEGIVQRLFAGIDKFSLMAIPFFILAANAMNLGGMSKRIVNLAKVLVGGFRGGMALTMILGCMFFGALSGSAPATVIAIGGILYPALVEAGYGESFSVGLMASASSVALLIPPSVTMIVYGAATGASVGALFMGGFGAGIAYGVIFMIYAYFYARRKNIPLGAKPTFAAVKKAFMEAIWAMGVPIIIIGGIYTGMFTPTEAAAVSAVYGIIVGVFIYKELDVKNLVKLSLDSSMATAQVMIMIGAAQALSWVLTLGQAPQSLSALILQLTNTKWVILLMMNVIMLIAGMFVDGTSFILILAPLFYSIAMSFGIDPVHLGIVTTANGAIGMFTPPFGLNLFVSTNVAKVSYSRVVKGIWPFIILSLAALGVITYLPQISMWLPNIVYGK